MESIEDSLQRLGRSGNLRNIPPDSRGDGLVDFTSNDYLGLAADSYLQDEFFMTLGDDRPSLTSSEGPSFQQRLSCQHRSDCGPRSCGNAYSGR